MGGPLCLVVVVAPMSWVPPAVSLAAPVGLVAAAALLCGPVPESSALAALASACTR